MKIKSISLNPYIIPTTWLILLLLLHAPVVTTPLSFHFASFEQDLAEDLVLSGDATISDSAIQLNRDANNSAGRALYHKAMQLWEVNGSRTRTADFSTHFCINISSRGSFFGDGGISFLLLPPGSAWHPKSYGGSLGNPRSSGGEENQIVAVEFDLGLDPRSDHFGIDVNSIKSRTYVNVSGEFVNKGAADVRVDYNSTTKNLSASLGLGFSGSLGSYHVSYVVDLSVVLPEKVEIGFTASTGTPGYVEIHQVLSWSFSSSLHEEEEFSVVKVGLGTFVLVGVLILVLVVIGMVFVLRRNFATRCTTNTSSSRGIGILMDGAVLKKFSYWQLSKATNKFSVESKIGEGGFGCVYKGRLTNPEMDVAIKKLKRGSDVHQGSKGLIAEIKAMSMIKHRNLVKLIGWCEKGRRGDLLLVFEFIPNGNLEQHLFVGGGGRDNNNSRLGWEERYKIVCGLASGLKYLHEDLDPCVLHRDIKASNVMLDCDFNPKLVDFGLALLAENGNSMNVSTVAGTCGYMDPETGLTYGKKSDVYSFGILVLMMATGKQATHLAPLIRNLHDAENAPEGMFVELDPSLGLDYDEDEARRLLDVGFRCCDPTLASRPSMTQVMNALTNGIGASSRPSPPDAASHQAASFQRAFTIYATPSQSFQEPQN